MIRKTMVLSAMVLSAALLTLAASAALAQSVPQFQVDPFWPKALPNN